MTEFYKFELLKRLEEIYEVHILALASVSLLHSDNGLKQLEKQLVSYYGKVWHLKDLVEELQKTSGSVIKLNNLGNSSEKLFLTEPINLIKEYCDLNAINEHKTQKWFIFGNLVRNYLTHGHLDYENRYKGKKFPIEWNGNKITEEEIKKSEIQLWNFSVSYPLDLFNEAIRFAKSLPEN